jgi:hypothetical protein
MWIDLADDVFPARKALIGLQFADSSAFARGRELVARDPLLYHELYPYWSMIVVRRVDAQRFIEAGLQFTEIEQIDEEDLPPEDVAKFYGDLIAAWRPVLRERLRQAQ